MKASVGVVDYGMGNLGSVANALEHLGARYRIFREPAEMGDFDALILPGVGAFGDCMANLEAAGLAGPLSAWMAEDRPLLGICLGLQVLAEGSDEAPGAAGFGVVPVQAVRLEAVPGLKVPQMGWNRVRRAPGAEGCPLWEGIEDGAYFYFVHSYCLPEAPGWAAGLTEYGREYVSMVCRGHVAAVQFHPEKSQRTGLRLLGNFLAWSGIDHERV
jgi:glutamine amidotransferase